MARILGISQYLKMEVQPGFTRGRGTRNWKLICYTSSCFLTALRQHGLPASPYLCTSCFSLCVLSFTTVHGWTSPVPLKLIYSLMVLWSHLNPWEKSQFWASVSYVSYEGGNRGFIEHFRPHFDGRGEDAGHRVFRGGMYAK